MQCPVPWFALVNNVIICGTSSRSVQVPIILSTSELFYGLRVTYIQPFLFHSPHQLCLLSFYAHVHVIHCHAHLKSVLILFMKLKMHLKCMLVKGMQFLIAEY